MKRVALVLVLTLIGILAAFVDAYYGLLLYTWYAFASPLELTYGGLEGSRLSLLVGAIVLLTTFQQKASIFTKHTISYLIVVFLFACFCSLAVSMKFSLEHIVSDMELIAKISLMTIVTPLLLSDLKRLRIYITVIAISGCLLGAYYGIFGLLAGSKSIHGPGRLGDNNGYAVFLVSLLPFLYFAAKGNRLEAGNWIKSLIAGIIFVGNLVAIMLTFSRGGFLAGSIVLVLLLATAKTIFMRIFVWGGLLPVLIIVSWKIFSIDLDSNPVPRGTGPQNIVEATVEEYTERLRTLKAETTMEGSGESRTHFWLVALEMARSNPTFGVGLGRYRHEYSTYDFSDGRFGHARAVHNTPLMILAETGLFGFISFLAIILFSIFSQSTAKNLVQQYPNTDVQQEIKDYVLMLRISMVGFFLGSFFVVCIYHELLWTIPSISIALEKISRSLNEETKSKARMESIPE